MGNSSSSSQSSEEEEQEIAVAANQTPPSSSLQAAPSRNRLVDDDGVYYNEKEPRMTAWVCLLAASIIATTSIIGSVGGGYFSAAEWVLLVTVISIGISIVSLVFFIFFKQHFVGKIWGEGITSYVLLLFWIGGIAVAMTPSRDLAVSSSYIGLNLVRNANLYFSMWFGFISICYIVASWTMTYWTKAAEVIKAITGRLAKWWFLFVVGIVLLVSAVQFQSSQDCANGGTTDSDGGTTNLSVNACKSNAFAVALGAWSSLLTLIAIILSHIGKIHFYIESSFSVVLFCFYTAGVAVITYNEGSGVAIGNLYFSTWTGFAITIFLSLDCYHEFHERRAAKKAAKPPKKKKKKKSKHHDKSKAKSKAASTEQVAEPVVAQTNQQSTAPRRVSSMRSSLDESEFCDARDDLELTL